MLFVIINVVLGTFNIIASSTRYELSGERMENLHTVLEDRGVKISAKLPTNYKPRPSVNIVYEVSTTATRDSVAKSIFGEDLSQVLRSTRKSERYKGIEQYNFKSGDEELSFEKYDVEYNNIAIDKTLDDINIKKARAYAEKFIKKIGIKNLYEEVYIEYTKVGDYIKATCYPVVENIAIDDVYITMEIYTGGVSKARFTLAKVERIEGSYTDIMPIDKVLFGINEYVNNMLDVFLDKIVIEEVRLVYKKQNLESYNLWGEKNIPMYKLKISGLEKPIFVNAYINEYIK